MRRILVVTCFFLLNFTLSGQERVDTFPSWSLTVSPSALFNIHSGMQFGIEKGFKNLGFFELEYARIFNQPSGAGLHKDGHRVKFGYKTRRDKFKFLATMYYRRTEHFFTEWVPRQNFAFEEEIEYSKTKTLIGPTLGFGAAYAFDTNLYFEYAINLGGGIYRVEVHDFPDDIEEIPDGLFEGFSQPGDYFYPIIGISLKFKFVLART